MKNHIDKQKSAYACAKFLRISPQKARLVLDTVRSKPVHRAFMALATINRKAARLAEKVLKSAVANAKDKGLDLTKLYVSDFRADGGPTFKRFMPRSMGRADRILKRTTHLSVVVTEGERSYKDLVPAKNEQAEEETTKKVAKPRKKAAKKKTAAKKAATKA